MECVYNPRLTASEGKCREMDFLRREVDDLRQRLDEIGQVILMFRMMSETRSIELLKGLGSVPDISSFLVQGESRRFSGV